MIKFIEDSHRYIHENGTEFISVSKLFKQFQPEQDWDEIARKYAAKLTKAGTPTTGKEVRKLWKEKGEKSSQVGTLFHAIKEKELTDLVDPIFYDVKCDIKTCSFSDNIKSSIPINDIQNNTIYPELMIYDLDHFICGQSDKVIIADNKIHIWDYKTDKELTFKAFSNDWVKPRKLLKPLGHLDDCNGNHYAIKMSMYMYMLWKANKGRFKPGDIIIEHVDLQRDEDGIPIIKDGKPIVNGIKNVKLPYYKKEVEAIFKMIK